MDEMQNKYEEELRVLHDEDSHSIGTRHESPNAIYPDPVRIDQTNT